jgi:hypothetical protein
LTSALADGATVGGSELAAGAAALTTATGSGAAVGEGSVAVVVGGADAAQAPPSKGAASAVAKSETVIAVRDARGIMFVQLP